jgi:N-acetylglucosamine-6-sulfatase
MPKPTIVVIMCDDLPKAVMNAGLAAGLYPNILDIINNGTVFLRSHVTYALCSPSRATFFTGRYTHNHGVWTNYPPLGGVTVFDDSNYLPMWLTDYAKGIFGKLQNGYGLGSNFGKDDPRYVSSGWNDWQVYAQPEDEQSPTGGMYDYRISDNGNVLQFGHDPSEYLTDELGRRILSFIAAHPLEPKFIYFAPLAPHFDQQANCQMNNGFLGRTHVANRHIGSSVGINLPQLAPIFNEADVSDKPAAIRNGWQLLTPSQIACIDIYWHDQLESMRAVDDVVGAIVNALGSEVSNTVFIFTSDNGNLQGEHRLVRKMQPYRQSSEVSLFIRAPGYPKQSTTRLVCNTDLASTICAFAGVSPGLIQDGRSLVPLLINPNMPSWRNQILLTARYNGYSGYVGLRRSKPDLSEDELYVEHRTSGVVTDLELYKHLTDPDQMNSQHNNSAEQSRIAYLAGILNQLKIASGPGCYNIENL